MTLGLDDPVTAVDRLGERSAAALRAAFDIRTVRDLLEHYPRRYEDLGAVMDLGTVEVDAPATLVGTVLSWNHFVPRRRGRRLKISKATVAVRGGGVFTATFFNQDWRERHLPPGTVAAFSGTVDTYKGDLQISMPEFQILGRADDDEEASLEHRRLLPVYPASEDTPTWRLMRWIETALEALPPLPEHLPESLRDEHGLVSYDAALRGIHLPDDHATATAARRRLVFDELFVLQLGLQWRRRRLEADLVGLDNAPTSDGLAAEFVEALPFALTRAQERALDELAGDLAAERPMHRLLQGDVGAGKTVVAVWAMLCAVDRGRQAALMVPTAVLAEQHHRTLTELLAPLGVNVLDGVRVELLTSATTTTERRRILGELLAGRVDLVVGTHALIEEGVRFDELGLVVIDEQHRFGVAQRVRLKEKGEQAPGLDSMPDVLVMTATPIPRSLALTLYGDLEVTVLDELPPGRSPVVTQLITPADRDRRDNLYAFVREQAEQGLQTFVVCPLVEESDEIPGTAATVEHRRLDEEVLEDLEVGLLHGRMSAQDKEEAMAAFRRGEIDVLVTTTVIEVGVDVPTATVMVIEDAERFGISQLHQLRGRVGRGADKSYCVLFAGWNLEEGAEDLTEDAVQRLHAVASTTDGFDLAETDLEIRGEGQLFGKRQSGMPDLKIARLQRDQATIEATRAAARSRLDRDPDLTAPGAAELRRELFRRYEGGLEEFAALETG